MRQQGFESWKSTVPLPRHRPQRRRSRSNPRDDKYYMYKCVVASEMSPREERTHLRNHRW